MRDYIFIANLILAAVGLSSMTLSFAAAHEASKMECNDMAMNAMNADIQSMPDGEAKANAMEEMDMTEEMMGKKDMKSCEGHMQNAMKAYDK
jgi:hypothetical protein